LAALPIEEYLRTTYEPDIEYFHSRLQALCGLLISREQQRGFRVFTEQRVLVSLEPR